MILRIFFQRILHNETLYVDLNIQICLDSTIARAQVQVERSSAYPMTFMFSAVDFGTRIRLTSSGCILFICVIKRVTFELYIKFKKLPDKMKIYCENGQFRDYSDTSVDYFVIKKYHIFMILIVLTKINI